MEIGPRANGGDDDRVEQRDASPLSVHSSSPAELGERIAVERRGAPFLVYRDADGRQRLLELADRSRLSVGRRDTNALVLEWDPEVSRLHAELELVGGDWTVLDDGLSRNGTFLNGVRISGRHRLRDGDMLRFGRTVLAYRAPGDGESRVTAATDADDAVGEVTEAQRRLLIALCRSFRGMPAAVRATNQQIADELCLSVDTVKAQLGTLYRRFGIEDLPQGQKRAELAWRAVQAGLVNGRDLTDRVPRFDT